MPKALDKLRALDTLLAQAMKAQTLEFAFKELFNLSYTPEALPNAKTICKAAYILVGKNLQGRVK